MSDYKIIEVKFSTRSEVTSDHTIDEFNHPVVSGNRKRTTYLDAHVSFDYQGQAGSVITPVQTVAEIKFDENGRYTDLTKTPLSFDSLEDDSIKNVISEAIEEEIKSINLNRLERGYINSILATVNTMN